MTISALSRLVVPLQLKAAATDSNGVHTFEGLAATWDQDLGNDVIAKGAFKDSITKWKNDKSITIPLLDSHDQWSVMSALGQLTDAKETNDGLWTAWELLGGPEGDAVFNRLQKSPTTGRPIIGKMSIGYIPQEFSFEQPEGTDGFWDRIRHLSKVSLEEVSLVLFPMNPNASIDSTSVKQLMTMAKHTDPGKLSRMMKGDLRRLASTIGQLLKDQKKRDGDDDPPKVIVLVDGKRVEGVLVDTEKDKKKQKTPHAGKQDESDESDLSDLDQDNPGTDLDTDVDPDSVDDDSDDTDESPDSCDDQDDESSSPLTGDQKSQEPGIYTYAEALQQRLQGTLLKHRTSNVEERSR